MRKPLKTVSVIIAVLAAAPAGAAKSVADIFERVRDTVVVIETREKGLLIFGAPATVRALIDEFVDKLATLQSAECHAVLDFEQGAAS